VVKINFHGGKNSIFHGGKNQFFSPVTRAISVPATRAGVMLSFDWLAFAVKLCFGRLAFHGGKIQFSTVVKIIFSPVTRAISVPATRAGVMLSFDWLAFAVKLVLAGLLSTVVKINFPRW